MALNPILSQQVQPMAPVNMPSGAEGLGQSLGFLANLFHKNPPSEASFKQANDQKAMAEWTQRLSEISDGVNQNGWTDSTQRAKLRAAQAEVSAKYGVDVTSGAFSSAAEGLLGIELDTAFQDPQRMYLEDKLSTTEGTAQLAFTLQSLKDSGVDVTDIRDPRVVDAVQKQDANKAELANLQVTDDLTFKKALPVLEANVNDLTQGIIAANKVLEEGGVTKTNGTVQETFKFVRDAKNQMLLSIPAQFRDRQEIKNLFTVVDQTIIAMDDMANTLGKQGEIVELNPAQIRQADKILGIMQTDNPAAAEIVNILGLASNGNTMDSAAMINTLRNLNLDANADAIIKQPKWVDEAPGILDGTVMDIATRLTSGEIASKVVSDSFTTKYEVAPPPADPTVRMETINSSLTIARSFSGDVNSYTEAGKNGFIQSVGNLAMALGSNAASEDYFSAEKTVDIAKGLIGSIDKVSAIDPKAAEAIKTIAYANVAKVRSNADAKASAIASANNFTITSDGIRLTSSAEQGMYGPEAATYDRMVEIIDERFGGDLEKALNAEREDLPTTLEAATNPLDAAANTMLLSLQAKLQGPYQVVKEAQRSAAVAYEAEKALMPTAIKQAIEQRGAAVQTAAQESAKSYKVPDEVANDTAFIDSVKGVSKRLNIQADDLLRVIEFETAHSFSPQAKNPGSTATGLIQFLDSTAKGLGTTVGDLANMSRADQMVYVEKYLSPYKGRIRNFGDLYMAVHWPAGIGKDDGYVMYRSGLKFYEANKNLDTNGDGIVTRGEAINSVYSRTGGGLMTTPNTAKAEQFITETKADLTRTNVQQALGGVPSFSVAPPVQNPLPAATTVTGGGDFKTPFTTEIKGVADAKDQGLIRVPNSDGYSRDILSLLSEIGVKPNDTFVVANEKEFNNAVKRGLIKKGDKVLIGEDNDAMVVEVQ